MQSCGQPVRLLKRNLYAFRDPSNALNAKTAAPCSIVLNSPADFGVRENIPS